MKPILLVGNGPMAAEYAKVLHQGYQRQFVVSGRNSDRIKDFASRTGALRSIPLGNIQPEDLAQVAGVIVATSPESLFPVTKNLLELGALSILVEKPVALHLDDLRELIGLAEKKRASIGVAFNRRFYQSVQSLRAILETSVPVHVDLDFTEIWGRIPIESYHPEVLKRWIFANPIHVFDTAAHLVGGLTVDFVRALGSEYLNWHSTSVFDAVGKFGVVPASLRACWISAGRWCLDISTLNGKYRLSPFERLSFQERGSLSWSDIEIDYSIDEKFKPGLFYMVGEFLAGTEVNPGPIRLASDLAGKRGRGLGTLGQLELMFGPLATIAGYSKP